jgi:opacity protein-like surface antigen
MGVTDCEMSKSALGRSGANMKRFAFLLTIGGLTLAMVRAADAPAAILKAMPPVPPGLFVPTSAFYLGLGGGYDVSNFGTQNVYAVGTSDVYQNGLLTSSGSAAGPANIETTAQPAVAFSAQGGYFKHFYGSDWLWGAKFAYSYLGATSIVRNALLPQAGSFTPTGNNTPVPFTGNALVQSFQNNITHQLAFVPFIGKSFDRSIVYIGAGPTLSQVRTTLNGLIGFADINGARTDVSGSPVNFSSTSWVYGGAATIGTTYFLSQSWFIDVNYTFAMTGKNTSSFSGPFTNPNATNGSTTVGTMVGTSAAQLITQGITATINKTF